MDQEAFIIIREDGSVRIANGLIFFNGTFIHNTAQNYGTPGHEITNCVFWNDFPKWWQVRRWWRIIQLIKHFAPE